MRMRWPVVAAATTFLSTGIVPAQPYAGASREAPTPAELVAFLAEMRVGITEEEAAALLAMDGPELVAFLDEKGLAMPERLRRLGPGQSPAEVLTREDVAVIVAPLVAPPGEPKVTGISTDPDAYARMTTSLNAAFASRIGMVRLDDDGNVHVPVRNPTSSDYDAVETIGTDVNATITLEPLTGLTLDELETFRAKVSTRLQETDLPGWGVGLLGDTQTVLVTLPEDAPAELHAEIEALAANAATTASLDAGVEFTRADAVVIGTGSNQPTDLRDGAPVGGAKWIDLQPGGGCTMAYVVKNGSGDKRGMTAGHCASGLGVTTDDVYDMNEDGSSSNNWYGDVAGNWLDNDVDILTWAGEDWEDHTRIYYDAGWKTLAGQTSESNQDIGLQVCGTGYGSWVTDNSLEKCDSLDILSYDFTYTKYGTTVQASDTNCFERHTRPGDSGGPTYALNSGGQALAAGVTVGDHETSFFGFVSHYWCYTTITDALATGSYTLPTGK